MRTAKILTVCLALVILVSACHRHHVVHHGFGYKHHKHHVVVVKR